MELFRNSFMALTICVKETIPHPANPGAWKISKTVCVGVPSDELQFMQGCLYKKAFACTVLWKFSYERSLELLRRFFSDTKGII